MVVAVQAINLKGVFLCIVRDGLYPNHARRRYIDA